MKKSYQEPSIVSAQIEPNIIVLAGSPKNITVDPEPIPGGQGGY